jgi:glycosyltransferase involved in cell wall biosynthesis
MVKKKLRIALIAPFEEPVPPKTYGGTERVVNNLVNQLVEMGHDVTLFASGDSQTTAKLVPCVRRAIRVLPYAKNPQTRQALNMQGLSKAVSLLRKGKYDIVHNHFGWQTLLFREFIKQPMVTTLHGILSAPPDNLMHDAYKKENYISISKSQRRHAPRLRYVATVYNGINLSRFSFNDKPDDYLLFLGRIHPQKGPEFAIKIAKATKHKLIIAAKIDPDEEQYFQKRIKPKIDGEQIVFVGEVAHRQKIRLLKNAKAMLSPIQWDEPFGITNIEALACGTPVIAINRGALPEIIVDGKTGYLCRTINQMIKKVDQIGEIDRSVCRQHVVDKFSSRTMAEGYLKAYYRIINRVNS